MNSSGFWFPEPNGPHECAIPVKATNHRRYDPQPIPPIQISCAWGLHKTSCDSCLAHDITPFGIPGGWYCEPHIRCICVGKTKLQHQSTTRCHQLVEPKSATTPISRVICSLAYSQRHDRKSMIRSTARLLCCESQNQSQGYTTSMEGLWNVDAHR